MATACSWFSQPEGQPKKKGGEGGREVLLNDREGLRSTTTLGSIGRKPQICPKGMWESPSKKVMQPKA